MKKLYIIVFLIFIGGLIIANELLFSMECKGVGFDGLRDTPITSIKVIEYPEVAPNSTLAIGLDKPFELHSKSTLIVDEAQIQSIKSFILERNNTVEYQFYTDIPEFLDLEFLSDQMVVLNMRIWRFSFHTSACAGNHRLTENESEILSKHLGVNLAR